jgi:virulence factor Mce-like protein
MAAESFATVAKRRLLGLTLIVIVAGLITLSIAFYNKAFTPTVDVTLQTDHTGNSLLVDSDVKERGVIVGSVSSVTANANGATVKLALEPGRIKEIPENVSAQILPKTLFGEQYVSLIIPANPSGQHIAAGDTIGQDRSKGALETEKVLGDILPLLTAVQPAVLNATLTALAEALHNRGDALGQTLVNFDKYMQDLNATVPGSSKTQVQQLVTDLSKLGQVSLEYNALAPDIFGALSNLETSARTLVSRQAAFHDLLTSAQSTSMTIDQFLQDNRDKLIVVTGQTDKVYNLLDEYSPEFGCLFPAINKLYGLAGQAIYQHRIHLTVTVNANNLGPYKNNGKVNDTPVLVTGFGPNCFGLPDNPQPTDANGRFQIPPKYQCLRDGVNGGALTKKGESPNCKTPATAATATTQASMSQLLNSPQEDALVNSIIAGDLHTTPNKVPGIATLLAAPLLRGEQVVVK